MKPCRRFAALALLCLAPLGATDGAFAGSFSTDYSVSVRGLPVGSAKLRAELVDGRYRAEFSGRVKGLVRLFSDARLSAQADGEDGERRLRPAAYRHRWIEDDDAEIVRVAFTGSSAGDVSVEPPPRHPERYVPVTEAHKQDVLDPVSAFIWPAPDGATPELCDRTLPLFDGTQRFDLALSFHRSETFEAGDGSFSGPAIVCAIRYRPISGHRPGKESVRFMQANEEIEVWMAAAGAGNVLLPVKFRVQTSFGRVVLEAKDFSAD